MSLNPLPQITPHPSGLSQDQIDDLEARFADWQTPINICCIPVGLTFLFGTHFLLRYTSNALVNSDGFNGPHVLPEAIIWWFFPGFCALTLCFEITLQIWSIFIGRRIVDLYTEWDSRQPKKSRGGITYYDSRKVLRWMTLLIALPIGILTLLALQMHTTFAEDGIHEFGYAFVAPKVHTYGEIREIVHVHGTFDKHSKLIKRPYCVVDFADGQRWNQHNWDDSKASTDQALETTLEEHTPLPVTDILVLEDLPKASSK